VLIRIPLALLALTLAACGGKDTSVNLQSSPSPPAAGTACGIVSQAEIAATLGNPIKDYIADVGADGSSCTYLGTPNGAHLYYYTESRGKAGFDGARKIGEPISEVGDEAYWSSALETLDVRKATSYFAVQAIGDDRVRDKEIARTLGQLIAKRI
jgi:hypothetical protein